MQQKLLHVQLLLLHAQVVHVHVSISYIEYCVIRMFFRDLYQSSLMLELKQEASNGCGSHSLPTLMSSRGAVEGCEYLDLAVDASLTMCVELYCLVVIIPVKSSCNLRPTEED
jgi:hypothetical protein